MHRVRACAGSAPYTRVHSRSPPSIAGPNDVSPVTDTTRHVDPVCRMSISEPPPTRRSDTRVRPTISAPKECLEMFLKNPSDYVAGSRS